MSGPLAGIRVIEAAIAVLGPVAAQVLGDMGAEVIKVETPDGDPMRQIGPARNPGMAAYFLNVNRNKKSLVLDLKRLSAREAILRLHAAQRKVPLIGILMTSGPELLGPYREALRDLGYIEGQTVALELREARGQIDRLPAMAEELVRAKVDIIVASQTPAVLAAKKATR